MDDLVQQGVAAVKAGNMVAARQLLGRAVRIDSQNEQAWLWLSAAVETDQDRLFCLENVLMINPENEHARRGRDALREKLGDAVKPPTVTEMDHSRGMDALPPSDLEALQSFSRLVEYELTENKRRPEVVIEQLTHQGFPHKAVEEFVTEIVHRVTPPDNKRFSIKKLLGV
ncbi:MAG TPA: hypothetical protein ENN99_12310 [Chloroflexi bacterium]|nr:hypothetical protein [Chloroflexota bacterium]